MRFAVEFIVTATLGLVSLSIWWQVLKRSRRGEAVVAAEPRRDVPWQGRHVAVAFFVYLLFQWFVELAARWHFEIAPDENIPTENVEMTIWLLASRVILLPVSTVLVVTFLRIDLAATINDLGFSLRRAKADVLVGVIAFLAIGPIVYTLLDVLNRAYSAVAGESPDVHPLIKTVESQPTQTVLWLTTISAVLVAPIVEEFIFRAVLQGWLEKLFRHIRVAEGKQRTNSADANSADAHSQHQAPAEADRTNPHPSGGDEDPATAAVTVPEPILVAPIVVSSLLFASLHAAHGLAPFPLLLLALVLGFLYQRTHRILPCIVLHMSINGFSMLILWLSVIYGWPLS